MNRSTMSVFAVVCALGLALPASASLYYDLGGPDYPTSGNYNNIVGSDTYSPSPVMNCVDDTGASTGINVMVDDSFYLNRNPNGPTTPTGDATIFEGSATRDSLFGCMNPFYGTADPTAGLLFWGLDTQKEYNFTIFASRGTTSDNREAMYTIDGVNSGVAYLDAGNNTGNVAVISGIIPNASGEISLDITAGPSNNNSYGFFYIGAIKMDVVPEPATMSLLLIGAAVALRRR